MVIRWRYLLKKVITFVPAYLYEERTRRVRAVFPLAASPFRTRDHAMHGSDTVEWWYFTGVLTTPARHRPVGFEVTFFRVDWGLEGRILHTAFTDIERGTFTTRGAAWGFYPTFARPDSREIISVTGSTLAFDQERGEMTLQTRAGGLAIDLHMKAGDIMPQGNDGIIDMLGSPQASCYYSLPDMPTVGTITVGGEQLPVTGVTWHDHQWGSFSLRDLAWDWFSLRLDCGLTIMLFVFSRGGARTYIVSAHGPTGTRVLTSASVSSRRIFRTKDGILYPLEWDVTLGTPDGASLTFHVMPMLDSQYVTSFTVPSYWEGLCSVEGAVLTGGELAGVCLEQGKPLNGTAYVEITGYERLRPTAAAGQS
jgi:predicted secreted hydrolase